MIESLAIFILLVVLLFLSASFSAIETAFTSLSMIRAERLSKEAFVGRYVRRMASNPKKLIITVLIGNNIVNILLSVLTTIVFMRLLGDSAVAIITGALTFVILFFGEIIPKTYARAHNEKIVRLTSIPIYYLQRILSPISWFFEKITTILFFKQRGRIKELFGDGELATVLDIGVSQHSFTEKEKETIMKFLRIDDTPAKKVMTPLQAVFSQELHAKVKDALPIIKRERYSRVPLYDKDNHKIMGFIHIKDVSDLKKDDEEKELYLFSRGIIKVSEARAVSDVFKEMLSFHTHMAVVVKDDKAVGIITLEDVLEEFIGEIYDEKDRARPEHLHISSMTQSSRRQYVIEGQCAVKQVETLLNRALPKKKENSTLAEWMAGFIEEPKPRKAIKIGGIIFRIISVEKGLITKVKVINPFYEH